jgi:hypothetical protein
MQRLLLVLRSLRSRGIQASRPFVGFAGAAGTHLRLALLQIGAQFLRQSCFAVAATCMWEFVIHQEAPSISEDYGIVMACKILCAKPCTHNLRSWK